MGAASHLSKGNGFKLRGRGEGEVVRLEGRFSLRVVELGDP